MWSTFKNLWSSKPVDKYAKTKKEAQYIAHYLKHGRSPRRSSRRSRSSRRRSSRHSDSDSERINAAINKPLRSKNDDRIRRLKRELASLDHKYTAASESEGNTAELQRIVAKLESKFLRARQELAAELAKKVAKQNALGYGHFNMMPITNAAMMQASYAAPGLSSFAPPTPAGLNAAALGAAAHTMMSSPMATPEQIQLAQMQSAEAKEKAAQEAAARARQVFDVNAANDAATAQSLAATKQQIENMKLGLYGIPGSISHGAAAATNAGKGFFTRVGQRIGWVG